MKFGCGGAGLTDLKYIHPNIFTYDFSLAHSCRGEVTKLFFSVHCRLFLTSVFTVQRRKSEQKIFHCNDLAVKGVLQVNEV